MFIKLTATDDDKVFINLDNVVYFYKDERATRLVFCVATDTDVLDIFVRETPDEILKLLEAKNDK